MNLSTRVCMRLIVAITVISGSYRILHPVKPVHHQTKHLRFVAVCVAQPK